MSVITKLLSASARHLQAEGMVSTTAPLPLSLPTTDSPGHAPDAVLLAHRNQDSCVRPFFIPSPLAEGHSLLQEEIDRLCVIYADQDVQRAAGDLRYKLDRLADLAMFRSLIAHAIDTADRTDVSPIEALCRLNDEADDALESARADHRAHDAVMKARNGRLRPLVLAVGEISIEANAEREGIMRRLAAAESQHAHTGVDAGRFHHLQAAGLTRDQMAAVGQLDPEIAIAGVGALRARLLEVDGVLAQCKGFTADPLRRSHHLAGLGLDSVISQAHPQQVAGEVAA
jgi:hypothetical protein